jgi:hypothetical protein
MFGVSGSVLNVQILFLEEPGGEKFHLWYAGQNRSCGTVNDFNKVRER